MHQDAKMYHEGDKNIHIESMAKFPMHSMCTTHTLISKVLIRGIVGKFLYFNTNIIMKFQDLLEMSET